MGTQYRYLPLIAALYVTISQIAYVTAYKIVNLGFFTLPAGIILYPLVYTIGDVVTEVYGYKRMRRLLWESAICGLIFTVSVFALIHLPSPSTWNMQQAYDTTLDKITRIYFSVILGVTIGSFLNIYLMSKWKILVKGRYFWLRSFASTAIGEAIITLIVDGSAFIGTMPLHKVFAMMLSTFTYKALYALFAAAPATLIVMLLKKREKLDVYDFNVNFNPFKIDIEMPAENNHASA